MNKNAVFVHFELIFLLSVNVNPPFCSRKPLFGNLQCALYALVWHILAYHPVPEAYG